MTLSRPEHLTGIENGEVLVDDKADLDGAIAEALEHDGQSLVEVIADRELI